MWIDDELKIRELARWIEYNKVREIAEADDNSSGIKRRVPKSLSADNVILFNNGEMMLTEKEKQDRDSTCNAEIEDSSLQLHQAAWPSSSTAAPHQ
jgi:hypothetical protein